MSAGRCTPIRRLTIRIARGGQSHSVAALVLMFAAACAGLGDLAAGGGYVFADEGICPFENCHYETPWRVLDDIPVYSRPDTASRVVDSLYRGSWTTPITGEVHSVPTPFVITAAFKDHVPGDTLWMLMATGEGRWKLRTSAGREVTEDLGLDNRGPFPRCGGEPCFGEMPHAHRSTFWVKIEDGRGEAGWVIGDENLNRYTAAPRPPETRPGSEGTVVENYLPMPIYWRLDSVPVLRIDGLAVGPLSRTELAFLPDGNILVADSSTGVLRLFDTAGRLQQEQAITGNGPQQLRALAGLHVIRGGNIYAHDGGTRLLVLDRQLRVTRHIDDIEFRPDSVRRIRGRALLLSVLDDGSVITRDESTTVVRTARRLAHAQLTLTAVHRRGIPGSAQLAVFGELPVRGVLPVDDDSLTTHVAVTSSTGSAFLFAPADTFAYSVFDADGSRRLQVRAEMRSTTHSARNLAAAAPADAVIYAPDVTALLHDGSGRIWLGVNPRRLPRSPNSWYVFDSLGAVLNHISFPPNYDVRAVHGDLVLGILTSSDSTRSVIVERVRIR